MSEPQDLQERHAFVASAGLGSGMSVLDLGWEGECLNSIAETGALSTFVTEDIRDFENVGQADWVQPVLETMPAQAISGVGTVLYKPAQRAAKGQVEEWIDQGFVALEVGGRFYLAGRRDRGVMSYAKHAASVYGNCKRIGKVGRSLIFCAQKFKEQPDAEPKFAFEDFEISDIAGSTIHVRARPGVFSRDGLDPGTRLLIEHLDVDCQDKVLDWGCGWGALGMVCARAAAKGHCLLIDSNIRAISCAQNNIERNKLANATAVVGDARLFPFEGPFDLVVSNPPFHEGNRAAHPLVERAFENLKPDGRLMLVVMRSGPYLKHMEKVFGHAEVVAERDGYAVLATRRGTSH